VDQKRVQTERELRQAHQLLEAIFDHTHLMVAYLDPQFIFVRVNRAYAEADEREPHFFPGKNHFELYPNPENEALFRQVVETGQAHFSFAKPFEYAEHPERGVSYWDWSLAPVKDTGGDVVGLLLTLLNVTERVRAEEALRESEERYRTLFEQANDAIFVNRLDDKIIDVNRRACEMLGYTRKELLTMYVPDLQAPELRGPRGSAIKRELEQHGGTPFETTDIRRDGTRVPVEVSTSRLTSREGEHVLSIVRDITERKRVEQTLWQYTKRLRILRQVDRAILAAQSPQEIARAALRRVRELTPCLGSGVTLLDLEAREVILLAADVGESLVVSGDLRLPMDAFGEERDQAIALFQRGEAYVVEDLATLRSAPPVVQSLAAAGLGAVLNVPLIFQEELIGFFSVGAERGAALSQEHFEIAQEVADQLTVALRQARLHEQVQRHAEELEARVRERTAELRNVVNLMAGREVRMAELKEVIRQLRAQLKEAGLEPIADDPLLGP